MLLNGQLITILLVVAMFLLVWLTFKTAFDSVNYWKLFLKLMDDGVDGVDAKVVRILAFW